MVQPLASGSQSLLLPKIYKKNLIIILKNHKIFHAMVPGLNFINNHTLFGLVPLRNGLLLWIFLDVVIDLPWIRGSKTQPGRPKPKKPSMLSLYENLSSRVSIIELTKWQHF